MTNIEATLLENQEKTEIIVEKSPFETEIDSTIKNIWCILI